ncbi:MAG: hypothetical protein AAFW01_18060, partial [Pseudomonadota bacterium]
ADAELNLGSPQIPADATERLSAIRSRLEARNGGETVIPEVPVEPTSDVRASISRLEAVLARLEGRG